MMALLSVVTPPHKYERSSGTNSVSGREIVSLFLGLSSLIKVLKRRSNNP
jgi:hypothetical protein